MRSAGANGSAVPSRLAWGLPGWLVVLSITSLPSQGFERQPGYQREEFLDHLFEPFHQGQRLDKSALGREGFKVRGDVAGRRGEREQQRTELVRGLPQPQRVLRPQGVAHFGDPDGQTGFKGPAHPAERLGVLPAGSQHGDRVEEAFTKG